MGIAGIAALEDHFDAAEHLSAAPGVFDLPAFHLDLDAQMTLDPGDRIDDNSLSHIHLLSFLKEKPFSTGG
jgi:hypothetical protein